MPANKEKIFIFGASGHAKVVIDMVEKQRLHEIVFLADDDVQLQGSSFFGYPVVGRDYLLSAKQVGVVAGIVAIGNNAARVRIAGWIQDAGFGLVTVTHPSAQLSRGVQIGNGTVVMAGGIVNADSVIGDNVIINTAASIDHDCVIGNGAHIAPGCRLCGGVRVGGNSLIGAGSIIIPGVSVGVGAIVGAGATVIQDVADGSTVAGTPARESRGQVL